MQKILREHVLLSVQRALLGEVTPGMRAVIVQHDDAALRLAFYFDGPIKDEEREAASRVETEVMADMADPGCVTSSCKRVDLPAKIMDPGIWVFARNEV